MTDQLSAAVSTRAGAQLAGLHHRLKSPASLARKITTNAYLLHRTPDQAAAALNDIIRYTVTARRARDLVPTLTAVVEQLSAQGWTVHTVKQSFMKGNPYKGIHLIMTGAAGQRCEIQFHTETALTIKEQTHGDCKIYRDLNMSAQQRIRAFERCVSRWADVPTPPGLPALTTLGGAAVVVTDYRPKRPPIAEEKQP